ncbi:proton-conducting transporter membrane subunit, partial [Helicobacter typhlonius]|uniref:proton-conducting transporter transmembrane domain-containing protein n=1 Tax=Helicobacter typhlonius TaxID=76936 RepID=UPI002FE17912
SETLVQMVYIALFAPLIGAVFSAFFGHMQKCMIAGIVPTLLLCVSFIASLLLFIAVYQSEVIVYIDFLDWIEAGDFYSSFGFMVDSISVSMMVVVSFISTMVHIYSIGYMKNDKGFNRYFSYLSAFVFSMMLLVMSDNLLGLFAGWEGVGLCSYLLIGFWYEKESANFASIEAFVINRIADLALIIGIFLIVYHCESLKYGEIFLALQNEQFDSSLLMWVGALLFIGAMGKSAQFPFHTWLADAMEGPTPVSALIHAATMVTAGVYLLVRTNPLYQMIPDVGFFIASLGAFVAIFGARDR